MLIKQEVKHHAQVLDNKGRQLLSWKHHDQSRFDRSAFKQDHDALYQQYSKTSSRRVMGGMKFLNWICYSRKK